MIYQGSKKYPVDELIIHCSATRLSWMVKNTLVDQAREIDRWHREDRGWKKIGYHFLIGRDGARLEGRDMTEIGAGVEGHNRGVIHICLIGGAGSAATDLFERNFTPKQDDALQDFIVWLRKQTKITQISGHNEWAAKACPGFNVPKWLMSRAL